MKFQPGGIYHIYNRGNNREPIFFNKDNYRYFLGKMRKHLLPHADVLAWCLMPNHYHWLVRVKDGAIGARLAQDLGTFFSSYTRAIQKQETRTGSLFQQQYQAKELASPEYLLQCFCYVHQNPLRAALEAEPGTWPWSSFRDYTGLRSGQLCARPLAAELLDLPADPVEMRCLLLQTLPDGAGALLY
ncbi:transposase [Hymenobacter coccineus]|uniref:Transposase IS200-like domain-containing protein n=1 Tax=Hymenobacter coccineus TaxID=1908235 RepID=A0A1G1SZA0_9BACT|nr:transposase [Hymenobacter coccineus]OGX83955.1 hypothetical protein BEN49_11920 [Hymenobacter coccineus]